MKNKVVRSEVNDIGIGKQLTYCENGYFKHNFVTPSKNIKICFKGIIRYNKWYEI